MSTTPFNISGEPDFYVAHEPALPLAQGDILEGVLCIDGTNAPAGKVKRVMVLTDSCEIDKKFTTSIYAAVCSQMSNKAALRQSIALREVFAAFYTPEMPGILTEGFVDLRAIFRVSFTSIACNYEEHDAGNRWLQSQNRVACLSQHGTDLLQRAIARFFGYERIGS